ncbi:MAG: carboxypeptidase regulatory-like domain-containing protein, partial [Gemmatimonadaceae bacterium]
CFSSGVLAQSNAAGSIFGSSDPGSTVVIQNVDTGQTRTVQVDANGRFTATSLPIGTYRVTLQKGGQTVATREAVNVQIGSGSQVDFRGGGADSGTTLETVRVTGARANTIDVSATDTKTVFTAQELEKIPVARSIEAVALLAPGVVQADSRYPGAASFGGSAASENAFYINGYAVTNPLTNLGSTSLPFDGISQMQVITGGYGAEFGRATGGVVNIVTQRGGNEWKFGGLATYTPSAARATYRNIEYPNNGTANDGLVYQKRDEINVNSWSFGMDASGPIVKDRLFLFASAESTTTDQDGVLARPGSAANGYQTQHYSIPRWLTKLDWNINDNNIVEFTAISDVTRQRVDYFPFTYRAGQDTYTRGTNRTGGYYYEDGGRLYIGKYTGYLSDNFTISAVIGQQKQDHIAQPSGYDPSVVFVSDTRSISNPVRRGSYDQLAFPDAYDETKGGRLDLEWQAGDHALRFGYDLQKSESRAGQITSGPGYRWIYSSCGPGKAGTPIPGGGGAVCPGG